MKGLWGTVVQERHPGLIQLKSTLESSDVPYGMKPFIIPLIFSRHFLRSTLRPCAGFGGLALALQLSLLQALSPTLAQGDPGICIEGTLNRATLETTLPPVEEVIAQIENNQSPDDIRSRLLQRRFYENQVRALIDRAVTNVTDRVRERLTHLIPEVQMRHPELRVLANATTHVETLSLSSLRERLELYKKIDEAFTSLKSQNMSGFMQQHATAIRSRFLDAIDGGRGSQDLNISPDSLAELVHQARSAQETYRNIQSYLTYLERNASTAPPGGFPRLPPLENGMVSNVVPYSNGRIGDPRFYSGSGRWRSFEGQRVVPEAPGRTWMEAEVGLRTRNNERDAYRILYSIDGLLYYSFDHYQSPAIPVGRWRTP